MGNKESGKYRTINEYIRTRQNSLMELGRKIIETELTNKELHEGLKIREKEVALEITCLQLLREDLLEEARAIIDKFRDDFNSKNGVIDYRKEELANKLCKDFLKIVGWEED